jgi:predicted outer membrane lipoprotein
MVCVRLLAVADVHTILRFLGLLFACALGIICNACKQKAANNGGKQQRFFHGKKFSLP